MTRDSFDAPTDLRRRALVAAGGAAWVLPTVVTHGARAMAGSPPPGSPGNNPPAPVVTPIADYRFGGTLASSVAGAPPLEFVRSVDDGAFIDDPAAGDGKAYRFEAGGFRLAWSGLPPQEYTLVLRYQLDPPPAGDAQRKIVDFRDLTSDYGLYQQVWTQPGGSSGETVWGRYGNGAGGSYDPVNAGTYTQVAIVRRFLNTSTGWLGVTYVHVDGRYAGNNRAETAQEEARFVPVAGGPPVAHFFTDDTAQNTVFAQFDVTPRGKVDRIRIFDRALTNAEVAALTA